MARDKQSTLKGVILERISQFITYDNDKTHFHVCVYDSPKLAKAFSTLYEGRKYKSKPIKVTNLENLNKINECSIFYAENQSDDFYKSIVSHPNDYTLLVTNQKDKLYDGFMLAIYKKGRKINFSINHKALVDAKLKVNYRLLKVASKVINPVKH
jgi:hypothetical protein